MELGRWTEKRGFVFNQLVKYKAIFRFERTEIDSNGDLSN